MAAGDGRLANPVVPVENHPACRRNRDGDVVLPSGLAWRPHLLTYCFTTKILTDLDSLLKLNRRPDAMRGLSLFRGQKLPPIPHLLSVLVTPKAVRRAEVPDCRTKQQAAWMRQFNKVKGLHLGCMRLQNPGRAGVLVMNMAKC